jgi:hypothetical protein
MARNRWDRHLPFASRSHCRNLFGVRGSPDQRLLPVFRLCFRIEAHARVRGRISLCPNMFDAQRGTSGAGTDGLAAAASASRDVAPSCTPQS